MSTKTHTSETARTSGSTAPVYIALTDTILHCAKFLPAQGPITVFVHHNTLHAFEDRSFDQGVQDGGRLFDCHAYLPEEQYRSHLAGGRIRLADLKSVLLDDLDEEADRLVANFGTRYALRLTMLQFPLQTGTASELRWMVAETDALRKFRKEVPRATVTRMVHDTQKWLNGRSDESPKSAAINADAVEQLIDSLHADATRKRELNDPEAEASVLKFLWRVCRDRVHETNLSQAPTASTLESPRHRDLLFAVTGEDADLAVHELLIPFSAAFLDQGFADWELFDRSKGFYVSFLSLYGKSFSAPTSWFSTVRREVRRQQQSGFSPLESIVESLKLLGITDDEQEDFLTHSLLALRGWAGMVWQMETNAEWAEHPAPTGSLVEFLAIRLMLDRLALERVAKESIGFSDPLGQLRNHLAPATTTKRETNPDQRAFIVFQLAQVRGWGPAQLQHLTREQWQQLQTEITQFSDQERRRVYHLAFERKYRNDVLDAVVAHAKSVSQVQSKKATTPVFQLITCIDDREESFRRHIEEVQPECETFGVAGFYGTAMYYRGTTEAYFKPLCPVSIKPVHFVVEEPLYSVASVEGRRSAARRTIGQLNHRTHMGTRTFLGGILTTLGGSLAAFPLVGRILFPRTAAKIRAGLRGIMETAQTELRIERLEGEPGDRNGHLGYSVDEMTAIVEGVLKAISLTQTWSPVIFVLGHGSTSLNNPHASAYNCGACAGSQGGPNARAFALMANDARVRRRLEQRGLLIPDDCWFLGGYHDTTNDSVTFADLDRLPMSHRNRFEAALLNFQEARQRNAHERCRRFASASLEISPENALRHVEERPEDLSQVRPEYNHATTAMCIVGRRAWHRGLFMDRRAFLNSYDPTQDDDQGTILEGTLRAAIPVCAGISLEYYFSTVDEEGYGCGSKLPHNITSLLGVMTGASSDLRPGLSAQMVEIHEPMRLLFVIETSQAIMTRIIAENPAIKRLVEGEWVQLAVFDAESFSLHRFTQGKFVAYTPESDSIATRNSSMAWYQGERGHLGFASILNTRSQDVAGNEAQ